MKKAALLAALAFSLTGFAQDGKLGFRKGQKLEITTEMKKDFAMGNEDESITSNQTSTMITVYDVKDITPGGSVLEYKVKKMVYKVGSMGQQHSFDSEKEGDMNGVLGKEVGKSARDRYTLTLDPAGKITAVGPDNSNPRGKEEQAKMMNDMVLTQLGLPLSIPKAGMPSVFYILPARPLKQGDTWADSSSFEGLTKKGVYNVTGITDDKIMLDFTEDLSLPGLIFNVMGKEITTTLRNKSTGKMTVDRKTGILRQKTFTANAVNTTEVNGRDVPLYHEKITMTITVKNPA
jgi:hypothetical protein